jgi:hypothetical protein
VGGALSCDMIDILLTIISLQGIIYRLIKV